MATYNVTAQTRRVQFTGDGTAGPFAFSFQVNATSEIKVYVDTTVKTESSHYTVSLSSSTGAGTVSFTSGNHPTSSQTITILGSIPLSRTSVYTSGGQLTSASLESDFDTNMFVHQQTNEEIDRSLRLAEHDVISGADMTLPVKDTRKGTVLGFNATTGNPEAGPSITSVQSLANVTTAINLLGTSTVIEDLGLLGTSTVIEDMGLLATSGNITAMGLLGVSGVIEDMGILGTSAIVEDLGLLATSGNVTAMGLLGNSTTITAMGKLGNDTTIADMAILGTDAIVADMAQLANSTIIDDLAILANSTITDDMAILATSANVTAMGLLGTSANVTAQGLLGTSANVTAMGLLGTSTVIEDMGLLATSAVIEDMGILGTSANVTAMSNVSGSIANVNTVASNLSGVNSFAERYRIASSAPTSSLDVGDLYFDTGTNTLKVYKSSGWADAGSSVNGTSARFHYDISGTPTTVTGSDANSNTLAYDAGFIDVYVNGVRMSPADITTTSGSSVVFASALADGDEVDIVAFGTFSVSNIVSTGALNSGSITSGFGNIDTGSSTITTTGAITGGSLVADNITIDGTEIDLSSGDLTVDVAGDITLDADGGDFRFADGGTNVGKITISATDFVFDATVQDRDIIFKGDDGGAGVTALTLDMSDAGTAIFNHDIKLGDNSKALFGASSDLMILHDGTDSFVQDEGTGNLKIRTNGTAIELKTTADEAMVVANKDGAVELYHNNSKKFETTSTGVNITGHVTKPNLPSFHASGIANSSSSGATSNGNEVIIFNSVNLNNGSHFNNSNGRFTAPIAGIYYFSQSFLYDDNGSGQGALQWRKNGSLINGSSAYIVGSQFSSYVQASSAFIISLSASDYVDLFSHPAGWHVGNESTACGYLIG